MDEGFKKYLLGRGLTEDDFSSLPAVERAHLGLSYDKISIVPPIGKFTFKYYFIFLILIRHLI